MYTMHEALARERMSAARRAAEQERVSSQLAVARRWRWVERRAHSARVRHQRAAAESAASMAHSLAS